MLQINTKSNTKLVELTGDDGVYAVKVRKPGAGEQLTLQKSGRELTKLGKMKDLTDQQTAKLENLTIDLLEICLSLFKSDSPEALAYVQTLDVETLLNIIGQVFEDTSETADPQA